jgi:hypothetical protein
MSIFSPGGGDGGEVQAGMAEVDDVDQAGKIENDAVPPHASGSRRQISLALQSGATDHRRAPASGTGCHHCLDARLPDVVAKLRRLDHIDPAIQPEGIRILES